MADASATSDAVQPLYSAADAVNPAIITKLPDGTIITRGAGRVRNRQEKDQTFNSYDPVYFEDRSFGLMVEDHTPAGTQLIRTTYLPIAKPGTGNLTTNWRAWKQVGENGTFQINATMTAATTTPLPLTAPAAATEVYETKSAPQGRSMAADNTLEFELGIFLDTATLTTPGSRSSYHSDTFRYVIGKGGFTPNNTDYPEAPGPVPEARLGGDTTTTWLYSEPEMSFSQMALNIQHENVQNFLEGRRLFNTDFLTGQHSEGGPAFAAQAGKAGPLLNTSSCDNCHTHNGSGAPLVGTLSEATSLVLKVYGAPELGGQLRLQQGSASVSSSQQVTVMLDDGTSVELTRPVYTVTANSGDASHYSPRVAPQLVGLGLLEAVDETTVQSLADRLDCDQDGISGRPSYVPDSASGKLRLGRFGWKAETTGLSHQIAQDLAVGMGVSNALLPDQGQAELTDTDVIKLVTYSSLLGVPPQRDHATPAVTRGQELFTTVGCANCHVTQLVTGANHPFAELRSQTIQPFTDLLLHDMGPDLADESGIAAPNQASSPPSASEWRTPPLWGIGLRASINGHDALLHDGRAGTVLEAVLWHGGEAEAATKSFKGLPAADRDALLEFVSSL